MGIERHCNGVVEVHNGRGAKENPKKWELKGSAHSFRTAICSDGAKENPKKWELKEYFLPVPIDVVGCRCKGKSQEMGIERWMGNNGHRSQRAAVQRKIPRNGN